MSGIRKFLWLFLLISAFSCQESSPDQSSEIKETDESFDLKPGLEAITLLGDSLFSQDPQKGEALENFRKAASAFKQEPSDVDKLIWYGRRAAYLGFFQKAIDIYSQGLEKYPEETRLYRHRGHRYISTRQYKKAKADFEKAVDLIEGQKDQMEPDGLPNAKNIPLTTLHSNILYHLGLVYYLEGEYSKALDAFKKHNEHPSYDDTIVSGTHWMYMILRRMGEKEKAQAILASIHPDMEIIENDSYFECCLFYKGLKKEDELLPKGESQSSDDVFVYALGNWQMYEHSDRMKTRIYFEQLLKEGNPYSFAYLAAEADWKRLAPQH